MLKRFLEWIRFLLFFWYEFRYFSQECENPNQIVCISARVRFLLRSKKQSAEK